VTKWSPEAVTTTSDTAALDGEHRYLATEHDSMHGWAREMRILTLMLRERSRATIVDGDKGMANNSDEPRRKGTEFRR
jgi:hypothetical protein